MLPRAACPTGSRSNSSEDAIEFNSACRYVRAIADGVKLGWHKSDARHVLQGFMERPHAVLEVLDRQFQLDADKPVVQSGGAGQDLSFVTLRIDL